MISLSEASHMRNHQAKAECESNLGQEDVGHWSSQLMANNELEQQPIRSHDRADKSRLFSIIVWRTRHSNHSPVALSALNVPRIYIFDIKKV